MIIRRCCGEKLVREWQRKKDLFFLYCFTVYSQFGFMAGRTQLDVDSED